MLTRGAKYTCDIVKSLFLLRTNKFKSRTFGKTLG